MRGFINLAVVVLLAVGIGVGVVAATEGTRPPLVFQGDGISELHFGAAESGAVLTLVQFLGVPVRPLQLDEADHNCGFDAYLSWRAAGAWFDRGRFVGYAVGASMARDVEGATEKGLRLNDSVAEARRIYGPSLRVSTEQGGAWFAATASGQIEGYLSANPVYASASSSIASIGAGNEGCPAMEP